MRTQLILDAGRGDSFVLLCLSLAALKRCFANHVQRLQLPHHLSRSPGDVCLPPSMWQSNLCPAGCLLKAEQPNSIALTLSAVSFLQSQWQSWKVSSWNFSPGFFYVPQVSGSWNLSLLGKAKPILSHRRKQEYTSRASLIFPVAGKSNRSCLTQTAFAQKWTLQAVLQMTAPHAATSRHPHFPGEHSRDGDSRAECI